MVKLIKIEAFDDDNDEWEFYDSLRNDSDEEEFDQAIDSWHAGQPEIAEQKIKLLIKKNQNYIDAYHHLAMLYDETSREFEAYLCCREAVRIGLSAIPKEFSWKTSTLRWGYIENRPFLRAYHYLGLFLQRRGEDAGAIEVFSRILNVCPGDNIGVRYLLPALWLKEGDIEPAIQLCETYVDDYSPEIMFTYPLLLLMKGEVSKAKLLLSDAKLAFPLVAKELLKKRHVKSKSYRLPGGITVGGADQAYEYWERYGEYWLENELAMGLITEK